MEQTWFYFLSSVSSFLFLLLLSKLLSLHKQREEKRFPPSPPSVPIIGHLHLIKHPVHRVLHQFSQTHGPIFTLRFGSRPVVVISSPSAVEECFTKNDVILAYRPRLLVGKHLSYNNTALVATPYGPHWRNLRRITTLEFFSTKQLNMRLGNRRDEIRALLKNLFKDSQENCFVKVEMQSKLSELPMNIIMRMVAGKRNFGVGVEVDDVEEARRIRGIIRETAELSAASHPGDYLPFLQWFDFQSLEKRMQRLHNKKDGLLQGLIDEHRNGINITEGKSKSFIASMLSPHDSDPQLHDDIIKGIISTLLVAGTDTIAVTLEWAMSLLVNHPMVLEKARAELDYYVGEGRLVDEPDVGKLQYLQGIVNEAQRLFPAAPLLVPHEASVNCTIGGFDVARGTMLLVNAWAIHRDPKVWDDPTSFRPERYEGGGGEAYNKLIPFGMGRRQCPGAGLAKRVLGLALAALIQCFEWERVNEELVDMTEGKGLTMPKAKPLEAMCRARKKMINVLSQL